MLPSSIVEISQPKFNVEFDLRYASTNNVCGVAMYSRATCYLHQDAANALSRAIAIATKHGLTFKIFDGFRPLKTQKFMFDKFAINGKCDFISDPKNGSIPHCRGVAVDLTLIDLTTKKELEMGCDFDEFSELAFHNCTKISTAAIKNRQLLFDIMKEAGWDFYSKEWWHYQLFDARKYAVYEIEL